MLVANASTAALERTLILLEENMEGVTVRIPSHLSFLADVNVYQIHSLVGVNIQSGRARQREFTTVGLSSALLDFMGRNRSRTDKLAAPNMTREKYILPPCRELGLHARQVERLLPDCPSSRKND
jgi:hypothetical protein